LSEILKKTIQGLPQGFRVVFVLRDVDGLSTEETAEALGLSVPAVKSRLLRARLQLRERLSRYFKRKTSPASQATAPPQANEATEHVPEEDEPMGDEVEA
jgi:RNA polymerase sigma-70 factor, ECF subfamily